MQIELLPLQHTIGNALYVLPAQQYSELLCYEAQRTSAYPGWWNERWAHFAEYYIAGYRRQLPTVCR